MSVDRERILAEASDLLVTEGPHALTMRALARRLGVTAPALYRHFESRERIVVDLVGEAFDTFARYLYRALEGRTPAERFSLTGRNYLAYALEHPRYYELLHASHNLIGVEQLHPEAQQCACAVGQFIVDRVREAMDAGMLKPGDPESVARTIWAHSHGLITIYLRGLLRTDEAGFRRLFLESTWQLMEGIAEPAFAEAMRAEAAAAAADEAGAPPDGVGRPLPVEVGEAPR